MKISIKMIGFLVATSVTLGFLLPTNEALAQDVYSGCSCVTAPGFNPDAIGQIVFSNGEVLVDNVRAASGQTLAANSEIIVGNGSATYNIGVGCSNAVGANTIVSVSQPAGPGADLCVRVSTMEMISAPMQTRGSKFGGLIFLGGIGGAGLLVSALVDDSGGNKRPPASN
jgi:hypothetical protein